MIKASTLAVVLCLLLLFSSAAFAQVSVDKNFKPSITINHAEVLALARQSDGKIIAGGNFTVINSTSFTNLVRLNPDGTPDPAFEIGTGPDHPITDIQVQADDKVLVTGGFSRFNDQPARGLIRLNRHGDIDQTFVLPASMYFSARKIILQPDGKILLGGTFYFPDQQRSTSVIRLLADGSLDHTFHTGLSANYPMALALQADGKILAGGAGDNGKLITRLHPDGTPDATFHPNTGAITKSVNVIALQDDQIIVSGTTQESNTPLKNGYTKVIRLQADGAPDAGFPVGTLGNEMDFISTIRISPNKKIVLGGWFSTYNSNAISGLVQLNPDGTIDGNFRNEIKPNSMIRNIIFKEDSKILLAGSQIWVNRALQSQNIFLLQADGTLDNSFENTLQIGLNGIVSKIAATPDNKILVSGQFYLYNNKPVKSIVRLLANGSLDESFQADHLNYTNIRMLQVQADGKILIGGDGETPLKKIMRLHADGSEDPTFNLNLEGLTGILDMILQPDGKIIITASLNNSAGYNQVFRLNANGSLDETFQTGMATNSSKPGGIFLYPRGLQSDGKIIITGDFTTYNGLAKSWIVRLLPDGKVDESFTGPAQADFLYLAYATIQADDKILIGGGFTFQGNKMVRLLADGKEDPSFGVALAGSAIAMSVESTGKIIAGGIFTHVNGAPRNNIARLLANGSIDNAFNLGTGANSSVMAIASLKQDGTVYFGGLFSQVNGAYYFSLARVLPEAPALPVTLTATLSAPQEASLSWTDQAENELGYEIQRSVSPGEGFTTVHTTAANITSYSQSNLPGGTTYYYRIRAVNSGGFSAFTPEVSITTEKENQVISFGPLSDKVSGDSPFSLQATSTSGLPVAFTVISGPATLADGQLTLKGAGLVTLKASQSGNQQFKPAAEVMREFMVYPANPTAFTISNITTTGLRLDWEGASPEFRLLLKTTSSSTSPSDGEAVYEGTGKNFTFIAELSPNTPYFFTVYGKAAGSAIYSLQNKKLAASTLATLTDPVGNIPFLAGETGSKSTSNVAFRVDVTQASAQDGYFQVTTAANPGSTGPLPGKIKSLLTERYWKVKAVGLAGQSIRYNLQVDISGLTTVPDFNQVTVLQRAQPEEAWTDLLALDPSIQKTVQDHKLTLTNLSFFPEIALGTEMEEAPRSFTLKQNYPNPFPQATMVEYQLQKQADVVLDVIDGQGRIVHHLVQQTQQPGTYKIPLNGKTLTSRSVYFIRLQANGSKSVITALYH